MSTIELGDVTSAPAFEPGRKTDRRLLRRLALAALTVITLLGVTGSVRPPPTGLIALWSTPMSEADGLTLGADTAFVNRNTAGTARISAYDLATGAVRWETVVDQASGDFQLAEPAGLVLLAIDQYEDSRFRRLTIAMDARTGRRLWSAPGQAVQITAGTALMADYTGNGLPYRLRLIRLADRTVVWTRNKPDLYMFEVVGERVVTATVTGQVEVLRLGDGSVLATAAVRWIAPKPEESQFDSVAATPDYLVVTRTRTTRGDVTVYRLDTLTEQWRTEYTDGFGIPCGPNLCLLEGRTLTAHALSTGARRWQFTDVSSPWRASDDRVIVDRGVAGLAMIEPSTGRQVGTPVRGGTSATGTEDAVYVLYPTSSPPNRTSVTRWDLATGRSRLLGTLNLVTGYLCQIQGHYVACHRDHSLEVTALP